MSVLYKHNDEIERVAGSYRPIIYSPQPDWANAVAIPAAQVAAGYTVPSDGMIVGYGTNESGYATNYSVNNVVVARSSYYASKYIASACIQVPVNKGDIFKSDTLDSSYTNFHFVPWKE